MLRINLEVFDGKTMMQIGELHVERTGSGMSEDIGFYSVTGWHKPTPKSREVQYLAGEIEMFDRTLGAMTLAKEAIERAVEVDHL